MKRVDVKGLCAETPFDFSLHSTIRTGGRAKIGYFPRNIGEMTELVYLLTEEKIPFLVLGNLSNVLPSDEDYDGAIISTKGLCGVKVGEKTFVLAGTTAGSLLKATKCANYMGAEFLSGIPCTLGGALYMNAGAGGKYISEIVESVLVLREGKERLLTKEECGYAYKRSAFMENNDVILGAYLRLKSATKAEIEKAEGEYLAHRSHLPKGFSMGCVFKNPEGKFAGELIEGSGLKGFRIGGGKISETHANFILNDRGATSKDIRALITIAKNAVRAQYGIELQEEIRYL